MTLQVFFIISTDNLIIDIEKMIDLQVTILSTLSTTSLIICIIFMYQHRSSSSLPLLVAPSCIKLFLKYWSCNLPLIGTINFLPMYHGPSSFYATYRTVPSYYLYNKKEQRYFLSLSLRAYMNFLLVCGMVQVSHALCVTMFNSSLTN